MTCSINEETVFMFGFLVGFVFLVQEPDDEATVLVPGFFLKCANGPAGT